MAQARTVGSGGNVHPSRVTMTVLLAAAAAAGVATYVVFRREPEAWARWPQPAPALGAVFPELRPDEWNDHNGIDDVATGELCAEVALLSADPYHASLGSPVPPANLVA